MSRFGQLSYGQRQKQFIGQPVEDIANVNAALIDRYHGNRGLIDELQIMESNIDLIDDENDRAVLRNQMDYTNNAIKDVSESGAYEHATNAVRDIYKNFKTNKGLQKAMSNRETQKAFYETIDSRDDLDPRYKGISKQMANLSYQGVQQNEQGEWIGSYSPFEPAAYFDDVEFAHSVLKHINANAHKEGKWNIDDPYVANAIDTYVQKTGISREYITENRVQTIVLDALDRDPRAQAWNRDQQRMEYFDRFTSRNLVPTKEDIEAMKASYIDRNRAISTVTVREGETLKEARERAGQEYNNRIKEDVDLIISNMENAFISEGAKYTPEDIMEAVHASVFMHEKKNKLATIMASTYGYQKIEISHDIRVNELAKEARQRQEDLAVSIFEGWDVQRPMPDLYKTSIDLSNRIMSQERLLKDIKEQIENIPSGEEYDEKREALRLAERDYNNHLDQLNDERREIDKIFDKYKEPFDVDKTIGKDSIKALNNLNVSDEELDILREGIIQNKTIEELQPLLNSNIDDYHHQQRRWADQITSYTIREIYDKELNNYTNTIQKRYRDDPHTIKSMSINTFGSTRIDNQIESIETFLLSNLASFTDLHKGIDLTDSGTQALINSNNGIKTSIGVVTKPGGTNEMVFHVTIDKPDTNEDMYLTISAAEFQGQVTDEILTGLEEIAGAPNTLHNTRNLLYDIVGTQRGAMIPNERHGNLYNAIIKSGYEDLDINEETNPIDTTIGDMVIKKISGANDRGGVGRYKVLLKYPDGKTVNLAEKYKIGTLYYDSPMSALKHIQSLISGL